ncbi:hypothetical protein [Roseococcus sp. YIM B11640]|uniref:hypothetical protein n=1 Tax=Roseococcus sp. YIM B11640 TaxID=3133973 RepID=UPI003C7BFAB9
MRGLKPLPMARRRSLSAAPARPTDRLPDAASFYEAPRLLSEIHAEKTVVESATVSEIVVRRGTKE